jgi:hypothetical protein
MGYIPVTRFGRLKGISSLMRFIPVAPREESIHLYAILGRELDALTDVWNEELEVLALMRAQRMAAARSAHRTPAPLDSGQEFGDGDHLVEDHMQHSSRHAAPHPGGDMK